MKIIAIDYGDARTGVAASDSLGLMAHSVGVVRSTRMIETARQVAALIEDAEIVIIGLPLNMDGSSGKRVESTQLFAQALAKLIDVPIEFYDERLTTVSATHVMNERNLRGDKRKQKIDAVAAVILLQSYLDRNGNAL